MRRARKELSRRAAAWLVRTLAEGPCTVRQLIRSHGMRRADILEAAGLGIVNVERHGRSLVANLNPNAPAGVAKLPSDKELARGLTVKEREFLRRYLAPRGCRIFGPSWGSGADAYRAAFGAAEAVAETRGPALARRPSINAARLLSIRTGREDFPEDMHSAGPDWLRFVHLLDDATSYDWPPAIAAALREACTLQQALDRVEQTPDGRRMLGQESPAAVSANLLFPE